MSDEKNSVSSRSQSPEQNTLLKRYRRALERIAEDGEDADCREWAHEALSQAPAACTTPGCHGSAVKDDYCEKCGGPWKVSSDTQVTNMVVTRDERVGSDCEHGEFICRSCDLPMSQASSETLQRFTSPGSTSGNDSKASSAEAAHSPKCRRVLCDAGFTCSGIDKANLVDQNTQLLCRLKDALEEAANGLNCAWDTLGHCAEEKCVPTVSEVSSCRAYLDEARAVLKSIQASAGLSPKGTQQAEAGGVELAPSPVSSAKSAERFTHLSWHASFKADWETYGEPSQDTEGYGPDRGGFKAGHKACWERVVAAHEVIWQQEQELAKQQTRNAAQSTPTPEQNIEKVNSGARPDNSLDEAIAYFQNLGEAFKTEFDKHHEQPWYEGMGFDAERIRNKHKLSPWAVLDILRAYAARTEQARSDCKDG